MASLLNFYRSWRIDKVSHILACALVVYVVTDYLCDHTSLLYWYCLGIGILAAVVLSIGKELLDRKNYGIFDMADLLADGKGIILGTILITINNLL